MSASPQSFVQPAPSPGGSPPAAAARIAVLVVTADQELWTELGAMLGARSVRQFDRTAELVAQWPRARPAVVLLDGRPADGLASAAEQILTHGGALVPIAMVEEASLAAASALARRRALFDAVIVPLDADATRAVVDRAVEEASARFSLTGGDSGLPAAVPAATRPRIPTRSLWAGFGAAAALLAGLGWWLARPPTATPHPPGAASVARPAPIAEASLVKRTPAVQGAPSVPAEDVEVQLERARTAMRDKRFIEPNADNALRHYRNVLALDAQNGEARQGLERIAELLLARANSALSGRDYAGALRALEAVRTLRPDHPGLAALDAQVNQRIKDLSATQVQAALQANAFTRAATLLTQAERSGALNAEQVAELRRETARREAGAQIAELGRLAQLRITQGQLLDPPGDSAKFYLQQLRERGGASVTEEAARLGESYVKRLVAEARAAIASGTWTQVESLAAELRATPGAGQQADQLRRDAAKARAQGQAQASDQQRLAQLVRDRIGARRLLAPAGDSAAHYLGALTASDSRNPAVAPLREALGTALVEAARSAFAAGNTAEGRSAADAARELGVPVATLAALQAGGTPPAPASGPTLARALRVNYPPKAAAAGIEGAVEIEFDVSTAGLAENLRIVGAKPTGTFDAAALAAVREARFVPGKLPDGSPVRVTSKLKVRFALSDR